MPNKTLFSEKNPQANNDDFFAEVIESSLDSFLAQCWQWDFFPEFACLVQAENENRTILGCVTQIQTGSMDPIRYPFPYQKTEEELMAQQPQIFEFLKTTFKVQVVGFVEKQQKNNKIFYMFPPKPCKIHSFIKKANPTLTTTFFSKPDFLHILFEFSNQISNLDELLLAVLKHLKIKKELTPTKLDDFCQTFSILTGNDYRRMKLFLKRVENL